MKQIGSQGPVFFYFPLISKDRSDRHEGVYVLTSTEVLLVPICRNFLLFFFDSAGHFFWRVFFLITLIIATGTGKSRIS